MEPKNKQGTPCLVKTYAILLLIFACILAAGCSQEGLADAGGAADPSGGPDKNEKVIQTVIEKEFSGPDKTYQGLRNAVMDAHDADMSQEEYDAFMKSPVYSDYTGYMKKTYASYFTDNAYDFFITSTPAFRYSVFDGDFNLSPRHIDITQNEQEPTLYSFTFEVEHKGADGEIGYYNFEGEALVPEEGKIGKIQFHDLDGLQEKMSEQNAWDKMAAEYP